MSSRRIFLSTRSLLITAQRRSISTHRRHVTFLSSNHNRPTASHQSRQQHQLITRGISSSFPSFKEAAEAVMAKDEAQSAAADDGATEEDENPCPPWQNPLHHKGPDFENKVFTDDFEPGEEMPIVPLPPFSSPDSDVDAPPHIHELADEIIRLNLIELAALMDRIGEHFGFDDSDAFGPGDGDDASAGGDGGEEVAEEKTIFDLKLEGFDAKAKIKVIKEVRTVTGLGLKEAKELVEGAPSTIKKDIKMEEAEELKAKLEAAGATISIA